MFRDKPKRLGISDYVYYSSQTGASLRTIGRGDPPADVSLDTQGRISGDEYRDIKIPLALTPALPSHDQIPVSIRHVLMTAACSGVVAAKPPKRQQSPHLSSRFLFQAASRHLQPFWLHLQPASVAA